MPRLAIFDLDHTLLAGDSDHLWGRFLVEQGLVDGPRYAARNQAFYEQYRAGNLDIHEFAAFAFEPLVRLGRDRLEPLRAQFVEQQIAPIIATQAPALLERHRAAGDTLVITTATNRFITEPIAALLGVDHLLATVPEEGDNGFTGRIDGTPNFQGGKITRLTAWMQQHPAHASSICYSDSANDLPLLEWADEAVAVDPDPALAQAAKERGWRIISLNGPALDSEY